MDVGSSGAFAKAPTCHWSPIPPIELRGESIEELSTNGGFVSIGMNSPYTSTVFQLHAITIIHTILTVTIHVNRNFLTACQRQETGKDGLEPLEFLYISKILC